MDTSDAMNNKADGVVAAASDNKDDGVVAVDADDAPFNASIDPGSVKAGTNSGYKGPGDTSLTVGDPRFA